MPEIRLSAAEGAKLQKEMIARALERNADQIRLNREKVEVAESENAAPLQSNQIRLNREKAKAEDTKSAAHPDVPETEEGIASGHEDIEVEANYGMARQYGVQFLIQE